MADIKVSQMGEVLVASDNDLLNLVSYDEQNQTYVSGKVKASTLKSYMVDDLEVSDLYDTTITTPTDDDGLVYDATAQKWENKPVVTGDLWAQNGAHNLLYNRTSGSSVVGGLTMTTNGDKSITVGSGTTTSDDAIMLSGSSQAYSSSEQTLKKGTYTASINGGTVPVYLVIKVENDGVHGELSIIVTGSGTNTFTIDADCRIYAYLYINAGGQTSTGGVLYPMIKRASDPSNTYTPYAMTNLELTEELGTELYSHTVQSSETFRTVLNDLWNNCINSFTGDKSRLKLIWRRTSLGLDYQCPVKIKGGTYLTFGIFGVSSSSESFYQQYQVMASGSSFLTMTFNTNGTIASYDNSTNNANVGDKFIIAYQ